MITFEFNNPSGSSYFTLETITTSSFYPAGSPGYTEGVWSQNEIKSYSQANIDISLPSASYALNGSGSISINSINFVFTGSSQTNTDNTLYLDVSVFADTSLAGFINELSIVYSANYSISPYDTFLSTIGLSTTLDTSIIFSYIGDPQIGDTIPYTVENTLGYFSGGSRYDFGLVTSSYIAGTVIAPGYSLFTFEPNINIPANAIYFRGTGEYQVNIGDDVQSNFYYATQLTGLFPNPFPFGTPMTHTPFVSYNYINNIDSPWNTEVSKSDCDIVENALGGAGYLTVHNEVNAVIVRPLVQYKSITYPNPTIIGAVLSLSIDPSSINAFPFKIKAFKGNEFAELSGTTVEYSNYINPLEGNNRVYSDEVSLTSGESRYYINLNQNAIDDLKELNTTFVIALVGEYDYNDIEPEVGKKFIVNITNCELLIY